MSQNKKVEKAAKWRLHNVRMQEIDGLNPAIAQQSWLKGLAKDQKSHYLNYNLKKI